jgi:two-component system sensor histidine kinase DegS
MDEKRTDLIAEIEEEYNSIQRRLRENQQYVEQSTLEVERWQTKNVAISSQLKRIQDSFDTVPRQDIKVAYEDALDAKQRLLTMRSQLEKLQEGQAQLEHYSQLLERLLEQLRGIHLPSGGSGGSSEPAGFRLSQAGQTFVRIIDAQEEERQRLANSLHDGPAQSLTNFILQAEVCQRLFDRDPDRASNELGNLKTAASTTFQKIREFIFDLRPMMLDDLGLVPTMRRYAESFSQKSDIKVTVNVIGEEQRLARHTEVMMFRSIQTIIGTVRDELKATKISIAINLESDPIKTTIEDDGQGFDPEVALDHQQGDSRLQALNSLRDRLELVGGDLYIFSAEGETSRFEITLPVYEIEPEF